jgi:hypothetical protein
LNLKAQFESSVANAEFGGTTMRGKILGLSVGLFVLALGLSLAIWPQRYQALQVKAIENGGEVSPNNYFLLAWKHSRTTWTIRMVGVGAIVMACVIFGEILFEFPVSW